MLVVFTAQITQITKNRHCSAEYLNIFLYYPGVLSSVLETLLPSEYAVPHYRHLKILTFAGNTHLGVGRDMILHQLEETAFLIRSFTLEFCLTWSEDNFPGSVHRIVMSSPLLLSILLIRNLPGSPPTVKPETVLTVHTAA